MNTHPDAAEEREPLQRETVLSARLSFLRIRIDQMANEYEFADSKGEYRAVVAQLRAILAEES